MKPPLIIIVELQTLYPYKKKFFKEKNIITITIIIIIIIILVIIINIIIIIIVCRPPLVPTLFEVLWDEENAL